MDKILLVEDDERAARLVARILRAAGLETEHVANKGAALRAVRRQASWSAFVIDARLGGLGYEGLDVLERIADAYPSAPRAMISGVLEPAVINRAVRHGATFICKPCCSEDLDRFVFAALSSRIDDVELRTHIAEWGLVAGLTPKQQEILALAATGLDRDACREKVNVTASTYASHVSAILAKAAGCGRPFDDLDALVIHPLRGARARLHTTEGT